MKVGLTLIAIALIPTSLTPQIASAQSVRKAIIFKHHHTVAWSCGSSGIDAIVFQSGMAIDADGAFRAYHPDNRLGLDSIEHAGHPGDWWALATDTGKTSGHPVVQGKGDPAPGYYVSMTSLFDPTFSDEKNPHRFVDSMSIRYVVLPPEGFKHAKLGDFATVVNRRNGKLSGAIVADESARELPMGEGSIALAKALGVNADPRNGGIEDGVAYVVYPGSGNGRPRTLEEINSISKRHFAAWGGTLRLNGCLR